MRRCLSVRMYECISFVRDARDIVWHKREGITMTWARGCEVRVEDVHSKAALVRTLTRVAEFMGWCAGDTWWDGE